jgi:type I restriction enzyme S subunit
MELREGYKNTEIGVIPEDWEVGKIQDIIDSKIIISHLDGNHGALYPKSNEFVSHGIPYVAANDFINGIVDLKNCKFLSKNRASLFQKGISKNGDVLFAHNATVGPVALLKTDLDYVILSTTATYFRCNNEKLSNSFLLYLLQSPYFVKQYTAVMSQSTRNQVPITAQRKFFLVLPPLPEQTAIATVLSDTDALIQALEKKIAKKQLIKKGAMQKLLTPKEGWEVKRLGEIANVIGGGTPSTFSPENWNGNINWFTPTEVGDVKYLYNSKRKITEVGLRNSSAQMLPKGSILLTSRAGIGDIGILKIEACTNQGFQSLVVNSENSNEYIYYLISTLTNVLLQNASGSTFLEISPNKVKSIQATIPIKSEQIRIAQILSDMDIEIAKIEKKLAKYKQLKQGLMQNLLTGKIRLV